MLPEVIITVGPERHGYNYHSQEEKMGHALRWELGEEVVVALEVEHSPALSTRYISRKAHDAWCMKVGIL